MKKKFLSILSAFAIVFGSLTFTSCEEILNILLPELFGKIISVRATPFDGGAVVSWITGAISAYDLYIDVKDESGKSIEIEVNGEKEKCPKQIPLEENNNYMYVEGLTNNITYKFIVSIKSDGEIVDYKYATATPHAPSDDEKTGHTYSKTEAGSFIEVTDTSVVEISGLTGSERIIYANVNTSDSKVISAGNARKYLSSSRTSAETEAIPELASPTIKHFVPPTEKDVKVIQPSNRSGASSDTFDKGNPQIGQTRSIYVDQDTNISTFKQEEMKLYGIGYEPGSTTKIKCLVWANPKNVVQTGSAGEKVSLNVIKDITEKFIKYYSLEEGIFGETSNEIISRSGKKDILNYPTKDCINIVLTDIGKDGTKGTCGVVGYFWAKDYYDSGYSSSSVYKSSNEGKYFYIDIPFCNYSNKSYNGVKNGTTEVVSDTVISTLFHEYQHMIDYKTKSGLGAVPAWYNEMLSMLCEDLLQNEMGLTEKVQDGRIPNFNGYYYYSGIAQYLDSNSWISYGTAYAFGAWLARNYGGAALVTEMSKNDSVGIDSIVNAVNKINNTNKTWNTLTTEYIKAVAFRNKYSGCPTLNVVPKNTGATYTTTNLGSAKYAYATNVAGTTTGNGSVTVGTLTGKFASGINLWNSKYGNTSGGSNYYGPILTGSALDIQPTGFVFHPIDATPSQEGKVTLYFSQQADPNEKLYIFIQPIFTTTTADTAAEVTN